MVEQIHSYSECGQWHARTRQDIGGVGPCGAGRTGEQDESGTDEIMRRQHDVVAPQPYMGELRAGFPVGHNTSSVGRPSSDSSREIAGER